MVICLGWGADLHMAQQMPLPLTISCSSKSRLVLPFWFLPFCYLLTWVVPDKFQKSSKMTVCVCVCVKLCYWTFLLFILLLASERVYMEHNVPSFKKNSPERGLRSSPDLDPDLRWPWKSYRRECLIYIIPSFIKIGRSRFFGKLWSQMTR